MRKFYFVSKQFAIGFCAMIFFVFLATANGKAASPNMIYTYLLDADHLVNACTAKKPSFFSNEKVDTFRLNFSKIRAALIKLTLELHPELTTAEASEKIDEHIRFRRKGYADHYGSIDCKGPLFERRYKGFEVFISNRFEKLLKEIYPLRYAYDSPIPALNSSTGAKTYAHPSFQSKVFDTVMASKFAEKDCNKLDVISIDLLTKEKKEADNIPPFILPPILYTENWTFRCNGAKKNYDVKYQQDSEGPKGYYSILGKK